MENFLDYCLACQGRIFWVLAIAAYFIGSIPFGLFIGKLMGLGDVRKQGSGNIGATNLTRLGGKKLGALTLLLDAGKGAALVWLARYLDIPLFGQAVIMAAAVLGHIYSYYLRGKGGKGVATFFACLLVLDWHIGGIALLCWLMAFGTTRISSLSALFSLVWIVVGAWAFYYSYWGVAAIITALCVLIFYKHLENIRRLLRGNEA